LSIGATADADTIKKAFRREIARYHPDKVVHLGPEFQEMAATRAAELTVAYKTLSDQALREQYDASLAGTGLPPTVPYEPAESPAAEPRVAPPVESDSQNPPPASAPRLFESERAGRDQILKRAIVGRVRAVVESLYGGIELPAVRGFDAALVPVAKPRFMGSHPPRVLVKVNEVADATAIAEAWSLADRAGVHAGKSPVLVLLFGRQLSPPRELLKAMDAATRQRKSPGGPTELVVAVVNTGDWKCQMPDEISATVRKLLDKICA
jgi:hypothetical protein